MSKVMDLPRPVMRDVGRELVNGLTLRMNAGPAEPALDGYVTLLQSIVVRLETHVGGSELADAGRRDALARLENADCDVDTWLRHHESFFSVEGGRRVGPHVAVAKAIHAAAFPEGLGIVDDYVPDENRACRSALTILRAPEQATALAQLRFPMVWLDHWEAALDESDAAFKDAAGARLDRTEHISHGRDAEADFAETVIRLRRYIGSRADQQDKVRIAEGKRLLAPLLRALSKADAERKARATRRDNGAPEAPAVPDAGGTPNASAAQNASVTPEAPAATPNASTVSKPPVAPAEAADSAPQRPANAVEG